MSKSKGGGTGRGTDSKGWTRWKGKAKGKPAVKDNSKILGPKGAGAAGAGVKGTSSGGLKWTESGKSGSGIKTENGAKTESRTKTESDRGIKAEKGTMNESGSVTRTESTKTEG